VIGVTDSLFVWGIECGLFVGGVAATFALNRLSSRIPKIRGFGATKYQALDIYGTSSVKSCAGLSRRRRTVAPEGLPEY
jgi:hypothetical protein